MFLLHQETFLEHDKLFRTTVKTLISCISVFYNTKTSDNQRLGCVFDVTRLSLLCQVGDDVIRPCKICGGCQIRVPRSTHSFPHSFPYNLDSNLYCECVLLNAIKPGQKLIQYLPGQRAELYIFTSYDIKCDKYFGVLEIRI